MTHADLDLNSYSLTGDVIDDDGDGRVANIARYQGAEALLASRVPQLQTHGLVFEVHCF